MPRTLQRVLTRIGAWLAPSDLYDLDPDRREELARDIGVTLDDLYRLEGAGPVSPALLQQRLTHERLEPCVLQAKWPAVWKDMQRVCSLCNSKEQCGHDLAHNPEDPSWRDYCPNTNTIESLLVRS